MQYLDHAIWTALVSGLGAICGGCLMLPTLARDDMRKTAANTLRAIGVTVSGCGSHENLFGLNNQSWYEVKGFDCC